MIKSFSLFIAALIIACLSSSPSFAQQQLVLISPASGVVTMQAQVGATATTQIILANIGLVSGEVNISGFNRTEFSGSADSVFTLNVYDTLIYSISFSPVVVGSVSDTIRISGDLGTIYVILNGTATADVDGSFFVNASSISFGPIVIGATAESNVTVTNTSSSNETITVDVLADAEFTLTSASTFELQAGESSVISVKFAPSTTAQFADSLVISSAVKTTTLALTGIGVDANDSLRTFIVSETSIDFQTVVVGTDSKRNISVISLINSNQNLELSLANGTDFNIVNNANIELGALSTSSVTIEFAPQSTGDKIDTLVIASGGISIDVILQGKGSTNPVVEWEISPSVIRFGPAEANTVVNATVSVVNRSSSEIIITNAEITGAGAAEFQMGNPTFPITIAANSSYDAVISTTLRADMISPIASFTATVAGEVKSALLVQVFDTSGVRDTVRIMVQNTTGIVGGTARVIVKLVSDLPEAAVRGEITYQFNASVMVPIRVPLTSVIVNGQRQVAFDFVPEGTAEGEIMTSEMFTLTLGDAETTPVEIVALKLFNNNNEEMDVATFSNNALVSVEDAGGRTVNANSVGLSLQLSPNPAVNAVRAAYKSTGSPSNLSLYNSMGVLVADVTHLLPQTAEGEVGINLDALASGTYLVRLSSGTSTIVRTLVKR